MNLDSLKNVQSVVEQMHDAPKIELSLVENPWGHVVEGRAVFGASFTIPEDGDPQKTAAKIEVLVQRIRESAVDGLGIARTYIAKSDVQVTLHSLLFDLAFQLRPEQAEKTRELFNETAKRLGLKEVAP